MSADSFKPSRNTPQFLSTAGTIFHLPIPAGHTVLVYGFEGQATFGEQIVDAIKMAVFDKGDQIEIRSSQTPVRFMLMVGAPFGEPIVPYGPFVMNTREEIQQALSDLRNGTFVQT